MKYKVKYQFNSTSSNAVELTPEVFAKLNTGYQILVNLAIALGITPEIGEYQGNYYVKKETLVLLQTQLFE
jgi:hypothetical protein